MDLDAPITVPAALSGTLGADLLATYWPSALGLAVAALCVLLAVRSRRRTRTPGHRRIARTLRFGVPGALALVVALGLGVNTWVGYFPSVAAVQRWFDTSPRAPVTIFPTTAVDGSSGAAALPPQGARVTTAETGYAFLTSIPATATDVPKSGAWVYLPPDYDSTGNTARYPVIYALHGAPGSAADWFAGGRIDLVLDQLIKGGYIPPVIVVSPDLNAGPDRVDTEPLNLPGGAQLEDYVVNDVVAWADAQLRTVPESNKRVIAGMSSGGLGSLLYGLHHPDTFDAVVSIMPYTTPYTASVVADREAKQHNTPLEVIAARTGSTTQKIFLGQGDREPTAEATAINNALRKQGQASTLRILPGLEHNWTAARTIMPYGLVWVAQQLGWEPSS